MDKVFIWLRNFWILHSPVRLHLLIIVAEKNGYKRGYWEGYNASGPPFKSSVKTSNLDSHIEGQTLGNHPKPPVRPKSTGRPRGPQEPRRLQVKKRVMGKWKTHPVDKMVRIANFIEASNPDLAAKIWMRLLDSCELEEKGKKSFMPPGVTNESASEAEAMKALEEAERDDKATPQSGSDGMAAGTTGLQTETSTAGDLQGD